MTDLPPAAGRRAEVIGGEPMRCGSCGELGRVFYSYGTAATPDICQACFDAANATLPPVAAPDAGAPQEGAERESGWVIEHNEPLPTGLPLYWRCPTQRLISREIEHVFDPDHQWAVRFARREDAERMIGWLNVPGKAVEHLWVAPAAHQERTEPPTEELHETRRTDGDVPQVSSVCRPEVVQRAPLCVAGSEPAESLPFAPARAAEWQPLEIALRKELDYFRDCRDAPMTKGNKTEIATIRKTLNVVVCKLEKLLPPCALTGNSK